MKKIRDFIYNTNDILIAVLIVAAAAGAIWWGLSELLSYSAF